jgi:proton glutamate symport protein
MFSYVHRNLTSASLLALGGGLLLGWFGHVSGGPAVPAILAAVRPLGDLWVNALLAIVLPLVLTHMLAAVLAAGGGGGDSIVRVGGKALLLFFAMLVAGGLFASIVTPPLLSLYKVEPEVMVQIGSVTVPDAALAAAADGPTSSSAWISGLLPRNIFQAAAAGDILSLLIFTVLFGVAITQLPPAQREPLVQVVQGLAAAMMTLVRWVLMLTPLGVFSFGLAIALETGGAAVGLLGAFVIIQCVVMLVATGLLYPFTAVVARVPIRAFARALAPAQVVAVSTRSSIASLPALIQGAREHLCLPGASTGFVLPFSNSLFKLNRTISSTIKLLFLAHIYGITVPPLALASAVFAIILLSFSAVGVPGGGSAFRTVPVYLAAGIPIAGIVLLEAVDAIPDIFKTLLNVTGQMSAATVLARGHDASRPAPVGSLADQLQLSER